MSTPSPEVLEGVAGLILFLGSVSVVTWSAVKYARERGDR